MDQPVSYAALALTVLGTLAVLVMIAYIARDWASMNRQEAQWRAEHETRTNRQETQ